MRSQLALVLAFALLVVACAADDGTYLLRVENRRADTVVLQYGDVSFGEVPAGTVSDYLEVEPGPTRVWVDRKLVKQDLSLGEGLTGENYWTIYVLEDGIGLSAEDPPSSELTIGEKQQYGEALDIDETAR